MSQQFGVSAAHPLATEAGMRILHKGGNAVDASIAVACTLGVVEPYASGLGGGGNMLIHPIDGSEPVVYDYRETAPTHLNSNYNTGVPGIIKGIERISKEYGTLPLHDVMKPAIELAEKGFPINEIISRNLTQTKHKNMMDIAHFYPNKKPLQPGELLIQKELAETMKRIATEGSKVFYTGELAEKIIQSGVGISKEDLANYETVIRPPVKSTFLKHQVYTAPAPVGGALIAQALRVIEEMDLHKEDVTSAAFMAKLGNILKSCYTMRNAYMGDPAFVPVKEERLLEESAIQSLVSTINQQTKPPKIEMKDVNNTTHFSVIDGDGMVVSTTNTLSNFFGSGVYVGGMFLNNQMQNFSQDLESPNTYRPGKRCQSIIAPTILSEDGKPWLAIGASGAARIPTLITTVLLKYLVKGYSIKDAIADKRHFAGEAEMYCEEELTIREQEQLKDDGYTYVHHPEPMFYGGVQAVAMKQEQLEGAGDPRRGGAFQSSQS